MDEPIEIADQIKKAELHEAVKRALIRLLDDPQIQPHNQSTGANLGLGANFRDGSDSDLGPRLSLVRSSLNNGHAGAAASRPCGANSRRDKRSRQLRRPYLLQGS